MFENNTYDFLYDVVSENMKQVGRCLTFSRIAFQYDLTLKQSMLDLLALQVSNMDFVEIIYLHCLRRPMSDSDHSTYESLCTLPQKQFRLKVLHNVCNSYEYKVKKGYVINNLYAESAGKNKGDSSHRFLLKFYNMIPQQLKPIAKRIAYRLRKNRVIL